MRGTHHQPPAGATPAGAAAPISVRGPHQPWWTNETGRGIGYLRDPLHFGPAFFPFFSSTWPPPSTPLFVLNRRGVRILPAPSPTHATEPQIFVLLVGHDRPSFQVHPRGAHLGTAPISRCPQRSGRPYSVYGMNSAKVQRNVARQIGRDAATLNQPLTRTDRPGFDLLLRDALQVCSDPRSQYQEWLLPPHLRGHWGQRPDLD